VRRTQYAEKKIRELLDTEPDTDHGHKLKHATLHRYYRQYMRNKYGRG